MAIYTQKIQPMIAEYNPDTMTYNIEGRFTATNITSVPDVVSELGALDWAAGNWALPHALLPAYYSLTHHGRLWSDVQYAQPLTCYPSIRRVDNTTSASAAEIILAMEGQVSGVHSVTSRVQMTSEILYQSLRRTRNPAPPPIYFNDYRALGVDFQGVPRDVPMVVYTVRSCVQIGVFHDVVALANLIAGAVNEDGWIAPWAYDPLTPQSEGQFLYLGPVATSLNRRSRKAIITHEFARLQSRNQQHIFVWFDYTQVVNETTGRLDREYDIVSTQGYIQKVPGELWWDGVTIIPDFAALNLTPELW